MFYESYDRHLNYKQSKAFLELCFQEASKAAFLSVYPGIYMDCEEDYHRIDKKYQDRVVTVLRIMKK